MKGFWLAALALAAWMPAHATVIGVAVNGNGSAGPVNPVGQPNADGSIDFYALLNGDGVYGVGGAGLSPDTCTVGWLTSNCGGGELDMWLSFSPVTDGANELTLRFTDLDLAGVNDPWYFLESVEVFSGGVSRGLYDSFSDTGVATSSTNDWNQTIRIVINDVADDPFYTLLRFQTEFFLAPPGTYTNTPERLLATIAPVSVPEPATLTLLGSGLLLLGFASRRRRV